ncbi:MAG: hypothetical protein ACRESW_04600, partial [Nevskiales bacterium]
MLNKIKSLQELVQDAIDRGATSVEEVHRSIASMPFDQLEKIALLESPSQKARELTEQSIGAVYEAIRTVNQRTGQIARDLLAKLDRSTPSHTGGRGRRGRAKTTTRRRKAK